MSTHKSILLVDDSQFMRNYLKNLILKHCKYEFIEGSNGHDGIRLYKEHQPDITIMDITMPHLNGIAALTEIMKYDQHAKVIICSSLGEKTLLMEAIQLGAVDFIVKPYFNNLISVLNTLS
ncbi:response regulator [Heyndrickxia ginsengihumi]|uniref:Chemotaxis protein CheY n=2 Tax=Heyndrickxia ginsengihumi TaxID=363870 RepID=A0A0A6Y3U1_9BACI|nr:response regulator [Heyndrickxia ginsengihumi]KHD86917.1 chemotaxis protein CheY [Heyndrickxia ginsengihumi]MCM3021934.1 response regulator [Heyndrickxia ginsengihumi]